MSGPLAWIMHERSTATCKRLHLLRCAPFFDINVCLYAFSRKSGPRLANEAFCRVSLRSS